MKLRALLLMPLCGLACAFPAGAAGRAVPALPAPTVLVTQFRFDAGAPLLAPAGAAADGTLCVGTVEGYVHSLNPDGSFRWSHTVRGAINQRPVHNGQLWYIATNTDRVYALRDDGTLAWVFKPPSPIASELSVDDSGTTYYVANDRFLYGLSGRGGVSLRSSFGLLQAGPTRGPDGAVWARDQGESLVRLLSGSVRRLPKEGSPEFLFSEPGWLLDPEHHLWHGRSDGVLEFGCCGEASSRLTLPLAEAPLLTPAWSAFSRTALISARNGLVFAVYSSGGQRSP